MASTASNAHTVQIVAPPASLSAFVAAMTSGTWAKWNAGFLSSSLTNPGGTDPVISNGMTLSWDPVNRKSIYYGHGHNGRQSLTLALNDVTTTWTNTDPVPVAAGLSDMHQFSGQTCDPARGKIFFHNPYDDQCFYRPSSTTTWSSTSADPAGSHAQINGAAFNPTVSTQGVAVFGSSYGINQYDPVSNAWTNRWAGFGAGGIVVGDFSCGFYDVAAAATYMCGGSVSLNNVKVPATGSVVNVGNLPTHVGIPTSSNIGSVAVIADGYTTPGNTVRKPIIVKPGGSMWEYTSSSDTWTNLSKTSPDSGQTNYGIFLGANLTYDCLLLYVQSDAAGSMDAWVYKR
jgi:hypothetical protein